MSTSFMNFIETVNIILKFVLPQNILGVLKKSWFLVTHLHDRFAKPPTKTTINAAVLS